MKRTVLLTVAIALLVAGWSITAQGADDFVVIVNADNPISEISKSDLSGFLLKKKSKSAPPSPKSSIAGPLPVSRTTGSARSSQAAVYRRRKSGPTPRW